MYQWPIIRYTQLSVLFSKISEKLSLFSTCCSLLGWAPLEHHDFFSVVTYWWIFFSIPMQYLTAYSETISSTINKFCALHLVGVKPYKSQSSISASQVILIFTVQVEFVLVFDASTEGSQIYALLKGCSVPLWDISMISMFLRNYLAFHVKWLNLNSSCLSSHNLIFD